MAQPAFLAISSISCLATDDLTGGDTLLGVLGADRFELGRFNAGDTRDPQVNRPIVAGTDTLVILETDLTGDDELIRVDLFQDMDQDRVVGILSGSARYDIVLHVQSQPDG